MSFIANESASVPSTPEAGEVANDGFFPAINLKRLQESVRLDGTVTTARLRDAVVDAVIAVNDELAGWKATQLAAGATTMAAMQPQIDGQAVQARRYQTAIYRLVKADLNEKYANFDATKAGDKEADTLLQMVDAERRAARWAIRDILGVNRTTVELI